MPSNREIHSTQTSLLVAAEWFSSASNLLIRSVTSYCEPDQIDAAWINQAEAHIKHAQEYLAKAKAGLAS